MVEMYQLEQLLFVSKYGTLTKAADELHLSQSALSRSMQKLENELQISLFIRQKNKMELNASGEMAVDYAKKILEQTQAMTEQLRHFDRSQRTIFVGSCAPAPLWEITPALTELYPEMTISSEIKDNDLLLQGLADGTYQMIIYPERVEMNDIACIKYGEEHLSFSLPPAHPLSGSKTLHLKDLNGETMLLRSKIGFWNHMHINKMPDTRFLIQEEVAFDELVKASALPSFTSDLAIKRNGITANRITIPILDEEANVTYYCLYNTKNKRALHSFLQRIEKNYAGT